VIERAEQAVLAEAAGRDLGVSRASWPVLAAQVVGEGREEVARGLGILREERVPDGDRARDATLAAPPCGLQAEEADDVGRVAVESDVARRV
jgi:hypothetical protein